MINIDDLLPIIERKVNAALIIAGKVVATEARRSVENSPRGGVTYQKYKPRRTHKASAAGEAPATDLGFLARSITTEPDPQNMRMYVLCAHAIAPYAKVLEYGSMSGNLRPRPFMRPALRAKQKQAEAIVRQAVRAAIREYQQ